MATTPQTRRMLTTGAPTIRACSTRTACIFLFLFFYKGMIVGRTNSDQEMASTDMQGECERRNIDIGD